MNEKDVYESISACDWTHEELYSMPFVKLKDVCFTDQPLNLKDDPYLPDCY